MEEGQVSEIIKLVPNKLREKTSYNSDVEQSLEIFCKTVKGQSSNLALLLILTPSSSLYGFRRL